MMAADASFPPFCDSFEKCLHEFETLVGVLSEKDCRVVNLKLIGLHEIKDEYGRFVVWGNQIKARLLARAEGSLEDTLRHNEVLKRLVCECVNRLETIICQGTKSRSCCYVTAVAKPKHNPAVETEPDSVSSVSTESDSDSEDNEHQRQKVPKIRVLVDLIVQHIRSLYEFASLPRGPQLARTPAGQNTDEDLIVNTMQLWPISANHRRGTGLQSEAMARDPVDDIQWFCKRLARASSIRKDQLRYWVDRPLIRPFGTSNQTGALGQDSVGPAFVPSSLSAPQVAAKGSNMFPCGFCGREFEFLDWQSWCFHISRDVSPYICTFENCQNPEKLYSCRSDWIHHEQQVHRLEYVCQGCNGIVPTKEEMIRHLQDQCANSITPSQLSAALYFCARPVNEPNDTKEFCLICREEFFLPDLRDHLAGHMEYIALLSLADSDNYHETQLSKAWMDTNPHIQPTENNKAMRELRWARQDTTRPPPILFG
ncbi:uncharacterized protein LDX57_007405 [Aspergillus melleus]|uniref:uncharacterized protein n=1 Tax=Aspergillus melleus TaxID=138277 RepID=UPI001E8EB002|nr:uncharacterized protein LDX57_007405 [Aspergillus melleus]KAH8429733.1 hypothetical protein LDX57_007405 [Aspergillus melleus]